MQPCGKSATRMDETAENSLLLAIFPMARMGQSASLGTL